jgi:hypothetical protein
MQEGLKELEVLLDPYDWFYEVDAEPLRYVVYVTHMNSEQNSVIPDRVQGKQVVIHFARSKTTNAQEFVVEGRPSLLKSIDAIATTGDLLLPLSEDDVEVPDLNELGQRIDKLERQVGPNILFDIFFEIHDGGRAVTQLGAKFPEVRHAMQELYHEYGFDPIYNELEG